MNNVPSRSLYMTAIHRLSKFARLVVFGTLLVLLSLPIARTVWRAFGQPKPLESPAPNPVWPLWFAPHAFILTRRAGGLLVLGMILGVIVNH